MIFCLLAACLSAQDSAPEKTDSAGRSRNGHLTLVNTLGTHRWRQAAYAPCLALSPDGRRAVSAEYCNLLMWDLETGESIPFGTGHRDRIETVAFSPDGNWILSGSRDCTLMLWDAETGREQAKLEGHVGAVLTSAFSPDGKRALSAGKDCTLRLWEVPTGTLLSTGSGHRDDVKILAFSPEGERVFSVSKDLTLKLWEAKSGTCLTTWDVEGGVDSLAVSPDGKRVLLGMWKWLELRDAGSGRVLRRWKGHESFTDSVAFSPDGRRVVSGGNYHDDPSLKLWEVETARNLATWKNHDGRCKSLAFTPDGRRILCAVRRHLIGLRDAETGEAAASSEGHTGPVDLLAISPDGQNVLSGASDEVKLWELKTGKLLLTLRGEGKAVMSITFSPDGRCALAADEDGFLRIWDLTSGECRAAWKAFPDHSRAFHPTANEFRLLFAKADHSLVFRDIRTGKDISVWKETALIHSIAFSPSYECALTVGYERTIKLWEVGTGKELATWNVLEGVVGSLVFSPDGRRVACGTARGALQLWDVETGKQIAACEGNGREIRSVAFSPDGHRILTAADHYDLKLWDADKLSEIDSIFVDGGPRMLAVQGNLLIVGNGNTTLGLYEVRW